MTSTKTSTKTCIPAVRARVEAHDAAQLSLLRANVEDALSTMRTRSIEIDVSSFLGHTVETVSTELRSRGWETRRGSACELWVDLPEVAS